MNTIHTTLKVPYDLKFYRQGGTAQDPRYFSSMSLTLAANDANFLPEIRAKLHWYLNSYQQYRVSNVHLRFMPAWVKMTGIPIIPSYVNGSNPLLQNYDSQFLTLQRMLLVPDQDDTRPRSSPDEYYQARMSPNAREFDAHDYFEWDIKPTVLDVKMQQSLNAIENASVFVAGDTNLNASAPEPFPWLATRAAGGTTGSTTVTLNNDIRFMGLKIYTYAPYDNFAPTAFQYNIGIFSVTYTFDFRYPEYRLPIQISTWNMEGETRALIAQNDDTDYQTSLFTDKNSSAQFMTPLAAATSLKRLAEHTGDSWTNKILKPTPEEEKASSSAPSQQYHHDPAPPADHGSKSI